MKNSLKETSYKNNNKRGISLIVLVITIIVALILIVATVISAVRSIDNASITTFVKDITEIQEATESFYVTNNEMPSLEGSELMDKDGLVAIANSQDLLLNELTENNDLSAQFYAIDLNKIDVTKTAYGNEKLGANDIFVIAYPSMTVYYPYGLDAKGTTYFSITSAISSGTKTSSNSVDISATSVISSSGITVTKTNGWANKMGVNIEAEMGEGESLFMSVSGDTNRPIDTIVGKNIFGFDTLTEVVNHTSIIQVQNITTVEANYIELGTKPLEERYVDILKYKNSEIVGKVRIDLSKFSNTIPTFTSGIISSYSKINTVKISLSNNDSGIKEVRYEYLTKFSEDGTIVNYYDSISNFDTTYMKNKAKKAKLAGDLTTTIDAPKNVQSIMIAVIDNAGNIKLQTQNIAPNLYIGYTLTSSTLSSLQLTANMYSTNGIKTISFSKSTDGINFTNEQLYTLNTTTNGVTSKPNTAYTNFVVNTAYIKMVAVNNENTIAETRIVKISLNAEEEEAGVEPDLALGINTVAPYNATVDGLSPSYSDPIIPKGFKAVNVGTVWPTDWNSGLVIEDASGNQFVWVPVDGTNVPYAKWCTAGITYVGSTDDTLPNGITSELNQITNYGGFYIGRYEAAFAYVNQAAAAMIPSTAVATATWTNRRNATHIGYLFNFLMYTEAKTISENFAFNYGWDALKVKTGLTTGTQWDTMMKWIQNSGKNVMTNSTSWGNYLDSTSPANVSGYGALQVSPYSELWKANNIYGLAGNTWEFTSEIVSGTYRSIRGGAYTVSGTGYPAGWRDKDVTTSNQPAESFRVVLYIF